MQETIATGVPHVSVYMLEIDEDSRLGRELMAGGTRYHAHFVPDEDAVADSYLVACETLETAGVAQYEISNFARPEFESRHNLKYWTRQPYFGFGVDAHSMLPCATHSAQAVRFSSSDSLEKYIAGSSLEHAVVSMVAALEETFFLGLRLNRGVDLQKAEETFGAMRLSGLRPTINALIVDGLLDQMGGSVRLTSRGRLVSNEVFQSLIAPADTGAGS